MRIQCASTDIRIQCKFNAHPTNASVEGPLDSTYTFQTSNTISFSAKLKKESDERSLSCLTSFRRWGQACHFQPLSRVIWVGCVYEVLCGLVPMLSCCPNYPPDYCSTCTWTLPCSLPIHLCMICSLSHGVLGILGHFSRKRRENERVFVAQFCRVNFLLGKLFTTVM